MPEESSKQDPAKEAPPPASGKKAGGGSQPRAARPGAQPKEEAQPHHDLAELERLRQRLIAKHHGRR
jgi:hypothetical protein